MRKTFNIRTAQSVQPTSNVRPPIEIPGCGMRNAALHRFTLIAPQMPRSAQGWCRCRLREVRRRQQAPWLVPPLQ